MIKVVILEDNSDSLEVIETVIKSYFPDLTVLKSFSSVDMAYKFIKNNEFDWLILDIDLGSGIDGFDLLKLLENDYNFKVVFYSGNSDRTIDAIRHNAFDFLTKPLSIIELNNTIKRYYKLKESEDAKINKISNDSDYKSNEHENNDILKINTHKKTMFLKFKDINFIEAKGAYSLIYTNDGNEFKCSKNILNVSKMINDERFIRISRSLIVNVSNIGSINKHEKNESSLEFKSGSRVLVSNNIRKHLNDLIQL